MDIFNFRNQIINDYSDYVSSFISIAEPRLRRFVNDSFSSGSLWPDPLIQLNPTFKPGKTIDELVAEGVLHNGCKQVFRRGKTKIVGSGEELLLHQHQEDAIRARQIIGTNQFGQDAIFCRAEKRAVRAH